MIEPWNIVVMLGGPSAEREVSLLSGAAVANALRSLGHRVTELDPKPCSWTLPQETRALVNCRALPGHAQRAVLAALVAAVADGSVEVRATSERESLIAITN